MELRAAILRHADAYDLSADDEMLSSFALVAHWQKVEADDRSRYTTHFHSPSVPTHIAIGLFTVGVKIANSDDFWLDDDNDD